ncbi:MAG: GNAT family N-acetyltransferase [Planctomycetota bacterium]|jgi:predicted GNAT family acetyltransferase
MDVEHEPEARRFVIRAEGEEAVLEYREPGEGRIEFFRTFVPESLRGGGVAGLLVEAGIAWARSKRAEIIPTCPYVKKWLERKGRGS